MIVRNEWGIPTIIPQASHNASIVPPSSHKHPTGLEQPQGEPAHPRDYVVPDTTPWYQDIWEKSMGHISWPL